MKTLRNPPSVRCRSAIIGTATAYLLKFDPKQRDAGLYGFNPALVGIATLFFFQPGVVCVSLLVVGCVATGAPAT